MEQWKTEIKRLNKMRLDLGLNMNQLEKLTGVNRSRLKGFFEFTNEPRISFYFQIKDALENQIEVKFSEEAKEYLDNYVPKEGNVPIMENKPLPPPEKTFCNCKMEDNLFKRDKNCKMKKQLHKF